MQISHDDTCIAFKLHNFVQVTFHHQCEEVCNTFIYLNQYVRHDILLFHGLNYYYNMMQVLPSF